MKRLFLMNILIILILMGCMEDKARRIQDFIPGVYTRHYVDEYQDSYDTITIIMGTTDDDKAYTVLKQSHYEKQMNNGKSITGHTEQEWTGRYDQATYALWLQRAGKPIYFNTERRELTIGTQPYKKL